MKSMGLTLSQAEGLTLRVRVLFVFLPQCRPLSISKNTKWPLLILGMAPFANGALILPVRGFL
jgi:hypothetical protein